MERKILLVSDDPIASFSYKSVLAPEFVLQGARSPAEARERLRRGGPYCAVIVDMKGDHAAVLEVVAELGRVDPRTMCLLLTDQRHLAADLERSGPRRLFVLLKNSFQPARLLDILRSGLSAAAPARDESRPGLGVLTSEEVAFLVRRPSSLRGRRQGDTLPPELIPAASPGQDELLDELGCQPNPGLFELTLRQMLAQASRANTLLAVLDIGLVQGDGQKEPLSEHLVRQATRRLRVRLRRSDSLLRLSGDEFIVILWNVAKPEDAQLVARDILGALSESLLPSSVNVRRIGATIGASVFPKDGQTPETLLKKADEAIISIEIDNGHTFWFPNL
jgi:diguanylate cyclase (GGDEF)-like protein